jgi:hypothetical protein
VVTGLPDEGLGDHPGCLVRGVPGVRPKSLGFALTPAAWGEKLYGTPVGGGIRETDSDGSYFDLAEPKEVPASGGPTSMARGVLYQGNWAFDVRKKTVLWALPGLSPSGPAIPVADRLILVPTVEGDLVAVEEKAD